MTFRSFKVLFTSWLTVCAVGLSFAPPSSTIAAQATPAATSSAATLQANKQLALDFYTAYNQNVVSLNPGFFDQFIAANMVDHTFVSNQPVLDVYKGSYTATILTFPDVRVDVNDLIAQGDEVLVRNTFYGTQKGAMGTVPASNKRAVANGIDIFRVANGKFVEHWAQNDDLGLYQQLGLASGTPSAVPVTTEATVAATQIATISPVTDVTANIAVAQNTVSAVNAGTLNNLDPLAAVGFSDHTAAPGMSGLKGSYAPWLTAFPDLQVKVEDTIADGNEVAMRLTATGTSKGAFMGLAASGTPVTFKIIVIYRIANGKITDVWHIEDQAGVLQQLTPPQPPATAAATKAP